jgi:hypothetical protein
MIYFTAYLIVGLMFVLFTFSTTSSNNFHGFSRDYYWKLKITCSWLILFFWLFYVLHRIIFYKRDFLVVEHADFLVRTFWRNHE